MAKTCGAGLIRIALIVINFVYLLLGAGITYIGYWLIKYSDANAFELAKINFHAVSWVVAAVGVGSIVLAGLGFFGACCESSCMLNLYGILLILVIAAEIYLVVRSIKTHSDIEKDLENGMKNAMNDMARNNETAKLLQIMQSKLKCCGWKGPGDYNNTLVLPSSCCGKWSEGDLPTQTCLRLDVQYKDGCGKIAEEIKNLLGSNTAVGVIVVLIQIIIIFASFCLARDF